MHSARRTRMRYRARIAARMTLKQQRLQRADLEFGHAPEQRSCLLGFEAVEALVEGVGVRIIEAYRATSGGTGPNRLPIDQISRCLDFVVSPAQSANLQRDIAVRPDVRGGNLPQGGI